MTNCPPLTDRIIEIDRPDGSFAHYRLGEPLPDTSTYGWIFLAECVGFPGRYACKIQKPQGDGYTLDPQSAELAAFAALDGCPSLLLGFDRFETEEGYVGFFMEYCAGHDLATLLQERGRSNPMDLDRARDYCRMIVMAIAEVHSRGWAHRDVKPENFMIRVLYENNEPFHQVLLGDFGFATEDTSCLTAHVGTVGYIAPEVENRLPYSKAADMWSVGCCLYWIVVGRHPFDERIVQRKSLTEAVTSGEFNRKKLQKATGQCQEVVALIEGLLCPNPDDRLTAEQALASPFFAVPQPADEQMRECQPGI
jgi:serine/threonine protein kinase